MERILKKLLIYIIWSFLWIYKALVPINWGVCRFNPTCSQYAYNAFEKLPIFKAFILVTLRILKCNPMNRGGYDPVPTISMRKDKE